MPHELTWERLLFSRRRKDIHDRPESLGTGIGREEIERDYDRLLFCAPVRRLADKTQVFPMEKNDSIRTRLTHSHEVSNLARSLGIRLAFDHRKGRPLATVPTTYASKEPSLLFLLPPALHTTLAIRPSAPRGDVHPPMVPAQGEQPRVSYRLSCALMATADFRLVTKLQILNDAYGLNLTYATLAAMLKYPTFWDSDTRAIGSKSSGSSRANVASLPTCGNIPIWLKASAIPLAYVMEACDDIAYSVIDAEDIIRKGYASFNDLIDHLQSGGDGDKATKDVVRSVVNKNREFRRESLSSAEDICHDVRDPRKGVRACWCSESAALCVLPKGIRQTRRGYQNPAVLRLELEGDTYITETMDMLWEGIAGHGTGDPFAQYAYGRISENYRRVYESNRGQLGSEEHLLCDAVSGMTEQFLVALHSDLKALRRR